MKEGRKAGKKKGKEEGEERDDFGFYSRVEDFLSDVPLGVVLEVREDGGWVLLAMIPLELICLPLSIQVTWDLVTLRIPTILKQSILFHSFDPRYDIYAFCL